MEKNLFESDTLPSSLNFVTYLKYEVVVIIRVGGRARPRLLRVQLDQVRVH